MDTCVCNAHSLLTTLAPSGDVPLWWNPLGSAAIDAAAVGAYRAQASAGSPWGLAPANYAQTLTNWSNPGTNDLIEGNGAVPWVAATGWGFVKAIGQYFDTSIIPTKQTSVLFIAFSDFVIIGAVDTLIGVIEASFYGVRPAQGGNVTYMSGGALLSPPNVAAGNLSFVGVQGYRNGIADGGPIPDGGAGFTLPVYIGCYNSAVGNSQHVTANIQAVAIYNSAVAFTGADITAIAAVGTGSMHNL